MNQYADTISISFAAGFMIGIMFTCGMIFIFGRE